MTPNDALDKLDKEANAMLSTQQLGDVVDRIVQRIDPEAVILFGSYASGAARDDSDIDLLVIAETDLAARDRFPVIRRLLADFPAAFDVFWKTPDEYHRMRSVVNHVVYFADKYGRIVYERRDARSGATVVGSGSG